MSQSRINERELRSFVDYMVNLLKVETMHAQSMQSTIQVAGMSSAKTSVAIASRQSHTVGELVSERISRMQPNTVADVSRRYMSSSVSSDVSAFAREIGYDMKSPMIGLAQLDARTTVSRFSADFLNSVISQSLGYASIVNGQLFRPMPGRRFVDGNVAMTTGVVRAGEGKGVSVKAGEGKRPADWWWVESRVRAILASAGRGGGEVTVETIEFLKSVLARGRDVFAFTDQEYRTIQEIVRKGPIAGNPIPNPTAQPNLRLKFLLDTVTCNNETGRTNSGSDEIALGGTASSASGTSTVIGERVISSDFDTGEVVSYGTGVNLHTFDLMASAYPQSFLVTIALAEKDHGGFSDFITSLYEKIKGSVTAVFTAIGASAGLAIGATIGGTLGTAVGGPIGLAIGVAAGAILGAFVGWLASVYRDDLFEPQTAAITIPGPLSDFNGSLRSAQYNLGFIGFDGQYTVTYHWELER